ncbi:MAG TPA: class I SAM-dependent methyltransferase, partial [Sorangium sp.]|nr:class I SAM-dependent methyltransferase [Sorangium sp.]
TWEASARGLLGLCQLGDVLDVASGDGAVAELLAPRSRSITCLDQSERVIGAAQRRLKRLTNVRFECGDMHALPFEDNSFDAVLLMNCLTYASPPRQVVAEAARVLRDGGRLIGVTLKRHTNERDVQSYNHVNCGFRPRGLRQLLETHNLEVSCCQVTSRENRPPHFEVITFHASATNARA